MKPANENAAARPDTVALDFDLAHSPEKVWRALRST